MTQVLWLSKYFDKIGLSIAKPITIHANNTGTISNCINDKNHWQTKHIDVHHYFVKE